MTSPPRGVSYTPGVTFRARWDPQWYNLDQSMKVGRRDVFAFYRSYLQTEPDYDLVFANNPGTDWDYRSAVVESIAHATFGPLDEVDANRFGQYTFRFPDGRWVTIEAEEEPGLVNAASPGFPVDLCDPEWASTSGWALDVTVADLAAATRPFG